MFLAQVACVVSSPSVCEWDAVRWKVVGSGDHLVTSWTIPLSSPDGRRPGWKAAANLPLRIPFHRAALRQFHVAQLSGFLSGRNALLLRFSRPQVGRHPNSVPFFRLGVALHRRVSKFCWIFYWFSFDCLCFKIHLSLQVPVGFCQHYNRRRQRLKDCGGPLLRPADTSSTAGHATQSGNPFRCQLRPPSQGLFGLVQLCRWR